MEPVPLQYLRTDSPWTPDADSRVLSCAEWLPEMMLAGKMVVYANPWRSAEWIAVVEDMGNGAGRIDCLDCEGTGICEGVCWTCKGSGFDYVSI